jgi:hypothetical protein
MWSKPCSPKTTARLSHGQPRTGTDRGREILSLVLALALALVFWSVETPDECECEDEDE